MIVGACVALHVILLLSPPLQLTDLFNYLGYARLGGLHHLNPYTHVIKAELHDPVYRFTTWHNLRSPYGPLFTALSYPLALLPLPRRLLDAEGRHGAGEPRRSSGWSGSARGSWAATRGSPFVFVAANPIYLIYAVGGFHNDFFMLVPSIGGDRAAAGAPRPLRRRGADARRRGQVHGRSCCCRSC